MKSDLDRLMAERNLAALLVTGSTKHNPAMYYLANGAAVGEHTILVKKMDQDPILIAIGMERDEAAKSGLQIYERKDFDYSTLARQAANPVDASARLIAAIFAKLQITGRVGLYGREEASTTLRLCQALTEHARTIEIVAETSPNVIESAGMTKSAAEIARIRVLAENALTVIRNTRDFIASHRAENDVVVKADGTPLTVGDVKAKIRIWTAENNLEDPEGVIFAIGRDSAVPHSHGEADSVIRLGQTIVYDFFPCEAGGGYFYDFTRTWTVGYATPEAQKIFDDVTDAFELSMEVLRANQATDYAQGLVNKLFAERGHPTTVTHPGTNEGYVHSLGHGVGLSVHEKPILSQRTKASKIQPGALLTIEPGLYYPEQGIGVRLEDYVWVNPETLAFETIGEFDKTFVIELKG